MTPVFTPGLAGLVLGEFRRLARPNPGPPRAPTTPARPGSPPRVTEVLRLVAKGLCYQQIAERLVVSHATVQNHVQNILGQAAPRQPQCKLTRYAIEHGLDDA